MPSDLTKLKWKSIFKAAQDSVAQPTRQRINAFFVNDTRFGLTMRALVSLSLCEILTRSLRDDKTWNMSIPDGNAASAGIDARPRVKAANWIDRLTWHIQMHLNGALASGLPKGLNKDD